MSNLTQAIRNLITELESIEFDAANMEYTSDIESIIDELQCQEGTITTILAIAKRIEEAHS